VLQQSTFFARETLPASPFNVENRVAWDHEFLLHRLATRPNIVVTRQELGAFRLHADGLTGGGQRWADVKNEKRRMFLDAVGVPWTFRHDVEFSVRRTLKASVSCLVEPQRIFRRMRPGSSRRWN
jgi:hypothetical protein